MLGIVIFVLLCFAMYSVYAYLDCSDKAELENFQKDYKAWKENQSSTFPVWGSTTETPPPLPSRSSDWLDNCLDWLI